MVTLLVAPNELQPYVQNHLHRKAIKVPQVVQVEVGDLLEELLVEEAD